jgi:hypothetical protein
MKKLFLRWERILALHPRTEETSILAFGSCGGFFHGFVVPSLNPGHAEHAV